MNPAKPASILVTDDQSNIRQLLRMALETEGYNISEAADGKAALQAIEHECPDLMLLDLNMPNLDGMAVLEHMKSLAETKRPRIIVLTAYGSIRAAVHATRLGAADFLEKPITPIQLRTAVKDLLNDRRFDQTPASSSGSPDPYQQVLDQIRKSLRLVNLEDAQDLLSKAADFCGTHSAAYYNLLGILYESQHKWRLAKKCYTKAIDFDNAYEPAQNNFRRLSEIQRSGKSNHTVSLGEDSDLWMARLPSQRR